MKKVILEKKDRAATLFINRADAFNALDLETVLEMEDAVHMVEHDREIKVLLVRGKGKNFCTGADLKYFLTIQRDAVALESFISQINRTFNSMENLRVPVIAVVHGYCLAGGFELLQACDLAISSTDAVIGDQHANYGLMPGAGGTQRLPRIIGRQRAKELLYTGRWLSGKEAQEYGLVIKALPPDELEREVEHIVARIVEKSSDGLACMKKVLNQGMEMSMQDGISLEVRTFLNYFPSEDPVSGLIAFSEKRKPKFP
ncbi:MAG: enoyl-CoA hydratase/isomerase family protein [Deltaproteobacteria bacterium]|nr:enoyl-CoA hydratase/isomerase family protein [Deltaproteobacteria bacterium]